MVSFTNSWWQNRRERPNRSTNNGDMAELAKRPVRAGQGESVTSTIISMLNKFMFFSVLTI